MKFPESWLRSFCDPQLSTEALAERLTMSGLEVEEIGAAAPPFSGVVVARVTAVARHPNADKLSVCEVDVGGSTKTIVCGAPNVAAGLKVFRQRLRAIVPEHGKFGTVSLGWEIEPDGRGIGEHFSLHTGNFHDFHKCGRARIQG